MARRVAGSMTVTPAYWPNYCEENVWLLCQEPRVAALRAFAIFISNTTRSVAVWSQRSSPSPAQPVIWDYHVVLLVEFEAGFRVIDPDCSEPAPLAAEHWLRASFRDLGPEFASLAPRFRLVEAIEYRRELCTDRRHMRLPSSEGGEWASPPPPWPCPGDGSNLMRFVDMEADFFGEVVDLAELRVRLTPSVPPSKGR